MGQIIVGQIIVGQIVEYWGRSEIIESSENCIEEYNLYRKIEDSLNVISKSELIEFAIIGVG
ncbi:MAG: hypothetical protein HC936_16130 [Leptolyngbyaceae cyanobacterium SU_3_3]|nr:hypothetical protein [Leptolyngbyaceae cyanobacterium SU_3_3]